MTPKDRIVSELAEVVCKRIAWQTRMALTNMTDCRLSGVDSPLKNSWEEICVQCQGEESIFWSAYEDTVRSFVRQFVQKRQTFEIEAVWLQTADAYDLTDEENRPSINESSVADYIIQNHIYSLAGDWSNKRIRKHIESESEIDIG
jgi:hypothetical protein